LVAACIVMAGLAVRPDEYLFLAERLRQMEGLQDVSPVGAALVAARRATVYDSAGGHKARPYPMYFPFNFDEAHD